LYAVRTRDVNNYEHKHEVRTGVMALLLKYSYNKNRHIRYRYHADSNMAAGGK
jgi:hypothetical protein